MKALIRWAALALLATCSLQAFAQQTPITRYTRLTGNINFVATGGTLRTQASDACAVGATSSQTLSGVPAGASIVAAYLYWGGSGATVDTSVTLNGSAVVASRTFQAVYDNAGTDLPFFGAFADVTSRVSGNGTFTFGGLTVNTGAPHCAVAAVQAGWGLIAIYGSPAERLRAINVFDGLQYFRGSALTLTPNGFRIPASGVDGRFAVITWEGDPANSNPLNGVSEALRFNGALLDDGVVPAGSDPTVQQFDGTINSLGVNNSYGVDVDTYDVSAQLAPGQMSATTEYSAGGDLVLLTAQIVSVTSEPIVDLALTKTHTGDFSVGANAVYTLSVSNAPGSQSTDFPITVSDALPAGLTYVSASGSGWSCGASGQNVSCTHPGPLAAGASLPAITLTAAVGNAAYPSVVNTAQVTTPSNDPDSTNNSASDAATVLGPNLALSTKAVQDLNGGDANPGDTLRYTITIQESAGVAAIDVAVTDDIPANVAGFTVTTIPSGATNASTGAGTGANGAGYLNITGVDVPPNGAATIVFDVQVAASAAPGATIDNTATIDNPAGADATPSAPQIIVSQSQIPASGSKPLYLWSNPSRLHRTPPGVAQPPVTVVESASSTWTMSPTLSAPVTLAAGALPVELWLRETGAGSFRTLRVTLGNTATPTIATAVYTTSLPDAAPALRTITLNVPASITAPAGSAFTLTIENQTTGGGSRDVIVYPFPAPGDFSFVALNSLSVINVDSVQTYTAAYPGGAAASIFTPGSTVYVRSVVSDPFGSFDIAGADVTILDPASGVQVNNAAMAQAPGSCAGAVCTYEYAFLVPGAAALGSWSIRIVAREGTENTVTDLGVGAFSVAAPMLQVMKITAVLSDPINNTSNPKSIPGAMQLYTVRVTNLGAGAVDGGSLQIVDPVPANAALYVLDAGGAGSGPVAFVDGSPASGLTYTFTSLGSAADNLDFSNDNGASWSYTPTADADGCDAAVTHIRVRPQGSLAGGSGTGDPSFEIRFRVRVQ